MSESSLRSLTEMLSNDDEVKIVLNSPNYKEAQKLSHGIIISGEASESDDEIDTLHALPKSENELSNSESWSGTLNEFPVKDFSVNSTHHNSLLHKKLKEKNQVLKKNIIDLVTQPYESASREIHSISQQLIKSQQLVQDLQNTIRRLTNDLFDMEDKMQALKSGSLFPEMLDNPQID